MSDPQKQALLAELEQTLIATNVDSSRVQYLMNLHRDFGVEQITAALSKALLVDLEQTLIAAMFEPGQVRSLVDVHRSWSVEEIRASLAKYKAHRDETLELAATVQQRNEIIREGVRAFKEEATDAVNEILMRKAKKMGKIGFDPGPNPYRKDSPEDEPA